MEEIQEQRHVCKICSKSCVSGKSLGGHMRVHLAQISASKKSESKMEFKKPSSSTFPSQQKIKTGNNNLGSVDSDLNNSSYELRHNPNKSFRFTNSKNGISENDFSCKECGKDFPTTRALSGHMRCHSIIKNDKEVHQCKTCGKGFDSVRGMFGHMKTHSKKSRVPDNSADSLSDLDHFCPVRRKRSRIRYKIAPNPSLNESNSAVSEVSEVEIAAESLLMLSKGVTDSIRLESVTETSDDDSEYFGAGKGERIATENDNVSRFDDLDFMFAAENDFETSVDSMQCVENDFKFSKVSDDELGSVDKLQKHEELNGSSIKIDFAYCSKSSGSTRFTEVKEETDMDETISEFLKSNSLIKTTVSVNNSYGNHVGCHGIANAFEKKSEKLISGLKIKENSSFVNSEAGSKFDRFNDQIDQESGVVGIVRLESGKRKKHECAVCFEVFSSGQALGGHKRAHFNRVTESKNEEVTGVKQEAVGIKDLFVDLKFPVNVGGAKAEVGSNLSWVESSSQISSIALSLN